MSIVKDPAIWGTPLWDILHYITFNYCPITQSEHVYRLFMYHLPNLMPCRKCVEHYKVYITNHPIRLESKESLSKWLVKIHNLVNINKKKKSPIQKYSKVKVKYHPSLSQQRVINSFLLWTSIMRPNILQASINIQRSYSAFISFVFQFNFLYN